MVTLWAVKGDLDQVVPGTFEMEGPKGSGRLREFPEIDRVEKNASFRRALAPVEPWVRLRANLGSSHTLRHARTGGSSASTGRYLASSGDL